jgi:hypothetical protein
MNGSAKNGLIIASPIIDFISLSDTAVIYSVEKISVANALKKITRYFITNLFALSVFSKNF